MSRSSQRDMAAKIAAMNRRSQGAGYQLPKQPPGTHVALALNPLGPDYGEVMRGVVVDHTGRRITILWSGSEQPETWAGDECQYKVDRGLMIFTKPPKPRRTRIHKDKLICKTCGELRKDCDCPRKSAPKPEEWGIDRNHPDRPVGSIEPALTGEGESHKIPISNRGATPITEKDDDMATDEKLSAKEVARELGTDARTLRKFFRSGSSPVDPVGQGGRYEISRKSIKKVRKAFEAWGSGKPKPKKADPKVPEDIAEIEDISVIGDDDVEEIDLSDLEGPTEEDLENMDLEED